jgi:GT2 family glycosyltransferase
VLSWAVDRPVSVVVVNFNAGDELLQTVSSALASSVPVEVLVVDNASTDGSRERLAERYAEEPRVRILRNDENLGFAEASNAGIAEARGGHILLLNPDCSVEPGTIETVRRALDERPGAGMAGCLIRNPDGSEQPGCRRLLPTPGRAFVRAFGLGRLGRSSGLSDFVLAGQPLPDGPVEVEAISGAFMMVRRETLARVGLLDEGYFLHCEDLDWCQRYRQAGLKILFVPGAVAVHVKGRSSRDRPVRVLWHMHRGMVRFYRKFFRDRYPLPLMWLVFLGVWLRFGVLASWALVRRAFPRAA